MSQEKRYFIRIWKHDNWHCKPEGICPYDQSCEICHPVHPASLTKGFTDFWKFWIEPRCQGHTYTRHTIDYYKEVQESSNCEQVESIFTSLVETIRYQQHIPPASFETLVESLQFYWEITSRFRNWKVLYSNPSDTSSEDCKMIRPQDQQDVSASTVQESLDDTISGAKPLTNAIQLMIGQKGKIVKRTTNMFSPAVRTKEGVDYSVQHKEEEREE